MRIPGLMLALSGLLLVLIGVVPWFESGAAGPVDHQRFQSMQRSGDPGPLWLGWATGLTLMAFFGAALALAFPRARRARMWTWAAAAAYALVYAGLMISYAGFAGGTAPAMVAGFPIPTGLLVYGIYLFPVFLLLIPVLRFREWFFTPADEARFCRLLEQAQRRSAPGD